MDVAGSRFADLIGPHCPARDCDAPVIQCDGTKPGLYDAAPDLQGSYALSDTGGERPHARTTTVAQRFGPVRMHRRHESHCMKWKRIKKR